MKFKAAITHGIPVAVEEAFASPQFATSFLTDVAGTILGAENPLDRPAEYYIQVPDTTINLGFFGIEVRITGVSRGGRKASQFHQALTATTDLCRTTLINAGKRTSFTGKIQLFVVMMLDGDIETAPGSGGYSNTLESTAEWVEIGQQA